MIHWITIMMSVCVIKMLDGSIAEQDLEMKMKIAKGLLSILAAILWGVIAIRNVMLYSSF